MAAKLDQSGMKNMMTHQSMMNKKLIQNTSSMDKEEVKDDDYNYEEDELKEVSSNLSQLRRKFDEAKQQTNKKNMEIQKCREEESQLNEQSLLAEGDSMSNSSRTEQLETAIDNTLLRQAEELLNQRTYYNMMERMNKDLIRCKIKSNKNEDRVKYKNTLMGEQKTKFRVISEHNRVGQLALNQLMNQMDREHEKREDHIETLKKTIRNKEDAVARRLERLKRQQDIAEAAASDNTDQSELKTRQKFLIQKFYNNFIKRKMEKEMKNNTKLEDAYKRMKESTGIGDVQEMVRRFLTKEQTYAQYLEAVANAEKEIENLKIENEKLQLNYQDIDLENDGGSKKEMYEEIDRLTNSINITMREKHNTEEKYMGTKIVRHQILTWAAKLILKLKQILKNVGDPSGEVMLQGISDEDMMEMFVKICSFSTMQLKKYEQDIELDFNLGELAFEHSADYMERNVRIRPNTNYSYKNEESMHSHGGFGEEGGEKDEADIDMDINFQRRIMHNNAEKVEEAVRKKKQADKKEREAKGKAR